MNSGQKLSRDWRIGFQRNVSTLIWIRIIIVLVGVFSSPIIANIFPPDELAGGAQAFEFDVFALSRLALYGGLGLVIFGIFMYIITRNMKLSE